jgi:hypothetical protein
MSRHSANRTLRASRANCLSAFWTALLFTVVSSQAAMAQGILDVGPSGRPDERAITGGSQPVTIERNVPLKELLGRLTGDWKLVETGKAYWIGYTDDMFSIASFGDKAVQPLVELIETSGQEHTRYGAVLSLHLIGIERTIVGRFHEDFKNERIRKIFHSLLHDGRIRDKVLQLLVRDPWISDAPVILSVLAKETDEECGATVNALFRYNLKCPEFGGALPQDAERARVFYVEANRTNEIGELSVFTRESRDESPERVNRLNGNDVVIQFGPLGSGRKVWKFSKPDEARKRFLALFREWEWDVHSVTYDAINDHGFSFRYSNLGDPLNFQVSETNVFIITAAAAKHRWLGWWGKQSENFKKGLETQNVAASD